MLGELDLLFVELHHGASVPLLRQSLLMQCLCYLCRLVRTHVGSRVFLGFFAEVLALDLGLVNFGSNHSRLVGSESLD